MKRFLEFHRALGLVAVLLLSWNAGDETLADNNAEQKYSSAKEAFGVGAAFYNARNFKAAREPFEAVLRLAKDDEALQLRAYEALLQSYRLIPEFEPFQEAAEYIIGHHAHAAHRSLTRRSFLAFAYQRGQTEGLVKRYEKRLKKDDNDHVALYLLSEIYSSGAGLPPSAVHSKRAIELLNRLSKLEANNSDGKVSPSITAAEGAKISRQKGQLARQYMKARDYKQAAELYEEIAPLDTATHAWNLKEAASAWMKLNDKKAALRLALAAEEAPAEARNDQLTHFFERNLGDLFLQLGHPEKAIPHYRIAVTKTTIDGYVKGTNASLAEALDMVK